MNFLIDDCLIIIFEFLDPLALMAASKVCQRWDFLINKLQTRHYQSLEITSDFSQGQKSSLIEFKGMINLIQFTGRNLNEVKLTLMEKSLPKDNIVLTFGSRNYRCIDVKYFCLKDILQTLAENSGNILHLSLGNVIGQWEKKQLENLLRANQRLQTFVREGKFNRSESLEDVFLILPVTLKRLKFVDVNFFSKDILKLIQKTTLEQFKFTYSGYSRAEKFKVKPADIIFELGKRADELESLSFNYGNYNKMEISTILPDLKKLTNLKELHLSGSLILGSNCGLEILNGCPQLRHVCLDALQISEKGLSSILSLPNLETLALIDIQEPDKFYLNPKNILPKLKKLNLTFLDFQLDMESMSEAIEKMPKLSELKLPWTHKIDNNIFEKLKSIANSRDLKLEILTLDSKVQDRSNFNLVLSKQCLDKRILDNLKVRL